MTEFTGERVIPGEVNDDLWAEHVARYAFAARFAEGGRVLDIGCGTGYGTAELAHRASGAFGIDLAHDAVLYAKAHYPAAGAHFSQASAAALPFADRSFQLVTAFEVIEHLHDWEALLCEARRVLDPKGMFLVSTPNKLYYAESRAKEGPNPFHEHEFEFEEFREALARHFPRVTIHLQNRLESFAFTPVQAAFPPLEARLDGTRGSPAEAHFFLAVCGFEEHPLKSFLYVPRASNILREREKHIQLLEEELVETKQWLDTVIAERQKLIELHGALTEQLEEHNRWALQLETDWRSAMHRITQLQDELRIAQAEALGVATRYAAKVTELEEENRRKTAWAIETEQRLSGEVRAKCDELLEAVRLLDAAEATVTERTLWAQQLEQSLKTVETQLQMIRESRWLKLGRTVGLGPQLGERG